MQLPQLSCNQNVTFFSSKQYLHLMIEDALFSLQMYMRPLKQSEQLEEKKDGGDFWMAGGRSL